VGGKPYELRQFHFHRPSDGKPYDMVVHLMHEASNGKVAGVAALLKAGSANATIQGIWKHMPPTEGKEQEIPGVEVNPAGTLPHDDAYYTYVGSLTAPACTEGVTWFVLKTPVDVSFRRDQCVCQALSARCPAPSAAQRTHRAGESVTKKLVFDGARQTAPLIFPVLICKTSSLPSSL
jgi:carbonic anhydrase